MFTNVHMQGADFYKLFVLPTMLKVLTAVQDCSGQECKNYWIHS
jgi:hypothetical protein